MKTDRTSKLPHAYTQVIGSLPRPQAVRDLSAQRDEMPIDRLRREWKADAHFSHALTAINAIAENLPAEVHLHCCHSFYKRNSDVVGDYKPILPRLADAKVDRLNLEFAYPQTGDVRDLELLPDHLAVGMGVADVRTEELQSIEAIELLSAAGAQIINPSRIALNPHCGFAPGEPPPIDEAYYDCLTSTCPLPARLAGTDVSLASTATANPAFSFSSSAAFGGGRGKEGK